MRKKLMAIVFALVAFSLVAASAASLGGISTSDIGAEADVVAACDSDGVSVSFTSAFQAAEYQVNSVTVSGIDAGCDGQDLSVTLSDGTTPASPTSTGITSPSETVAIDYSAEALTEVDVVISG